MFLIDNNRDNVVDGLCIKDNFNACVPPTAALVNKFQRQMDYCVSLAKANGFRNFVFTAHLNHVTFFKWRNSYIFNPVARYNGWSYEFMMVRPLSFVINKHLAAGIKFRFAVVGEMGATLAKFPAVS